MEETKITTGFRPLSEYLDECWADPKMREHLREAVFENNRSLRERNEQLIDFIDRYMGAPDGTKLWSKFEYAERVVSRFERMDARISQLEAVVESLRNCDPVTVDMPIGGRVQFIEFKKIQKLIRDL